MPQKINKDDDFAPIKLKMRVANVFKKVEVAVLLDGVKIAGKKKQIVTPGEMETIARGSEVVQKVKAGSTLEVTLLSGGQK